MAEILRSHSIVARAVDVKKASAAEVTHWLPNNSAAIWHGAQKP